jgi:predicted metal-dependent peptidase
MDSYFADQVNGLYAKAENLIRDGLHIPQNKNSRLTIPPEFQEEFFSLVDKVGLSLMADKDNFYAYFLLQMAREIRFDLSSPTAVNFKGAKYVIYFNPLIFLRLTLPQMATTIKHEILHIVARHLSRARELKGGCSALAINMAMDIAVNTYLDHLPPDAVTLEWVNQHYDLQLLPFNSFEYYLEAIQIALDLLAADELATDAAEADLNENKPDDEAAAPQQDESIVTAYSYDPARTHELWEESKDVDDKTLQEFTVQFIDNAHKGSVPGYLGDLISSLQNSRGELPWNLYLKKLMGTVESNRKKTVTRRNRRQPERLDLRGELRSHKANIAVAIDISGSISDAEFNQAMKEVLAIVKNYNQEITIIECDSEIRRVYQVNSVKDIRERMQIRGATRFTPVFEYANRHQVNLLIYFTDGQGEEQLLTRPKGYQTLWIISGNGDQLSLKEAYGAVKKLKQIAIKDDALTISDIKREGYSMNDMEAMHI